MFGAALAVLFFVFDGSCIAYAATTTNPSTVVNTPTTVSTASTKVVDSSPILTGLSFLERYAGFFAADPRSIATRLIRVGLGFVGPLLFVLVAYSGLLWMLSGGDEDKVKRAKHTFMSAIIGTIIIFSAYSIVLYVFKMLGVEM